MMPSREEMMDTYIKNFHDGLSSRRTRDKVVELNRSCYDFADTLMGRVRKGDGARDYKSENPRLVVICLDWTGRKYFEIPAKALIEVGFDVRPVQVDQGRHIEGIYREAVVSPDNRAYIVSQGGERILWFDRSSQGGTSMMSGIKWGFENNRDTDGQRGLGMRKGYVLCMMDASGIANGIIDAEASLMFMRKKGIKKRLGPVKYFQRILRLSRSSDPKKKEYYSTLARVYSPVLRRLGLLEEKVFGDSVVDPTDDGGSSSDISPVRRHHALAIGDDDGEEEGSTGSIGLRRPGFVANPIIETVDFLRKYASGQ